jgi:hypothetical protein
MNNTGNHVANTDGDNHHAGPNTTYKAPRKMHYFHCTACGSNWFIVLNSRVEVDSPKRIEEMYNYFAESGDDWEELRECNLCINQ